MKKILFILGGLNIGGVETYILRLTKELVNNGCVVEVLLISDNVQSDLISEMSIYAKIHVLEKFPFINSSSWFNGMLKYKKLKNEFYNIIHVVDLMTLTFLYFNKEYIKHSNLSIGIYHSKEIQWWRGDGVYFREKSLSLYDLNNRLTLFPSESLYQIANRFNNIPLNEAKILPLGIDLERYRKISPSKKSLKIISIGRLVDFKTYNKNMIRSLPSLRKFGDFNYYVYGDGPEKNDLLKLAHEFGVADFVHFMGEIEYSKLYTVFQDAFCFIGSGTTIIEASAAGIPSIVGVESIDGPVTCGYFCDIEGFSYNEAFATKNRVRIDSCILNLYNANSFEYNLISEKHREKSNDFNIKVTALSFEKMSDAAPNFEIKISKLFFVISFFLALIMRGSAAFRSRFDK